jgi:hypothetical protein
VDEASDFISAALTTVASSVHLASNHTWRSLAASAQRYPSSPCADHAGDCAGASACCCCRC